MDKMIVDEWLKFAENDLAVVHIFIESPPYETGNNLLPLSASR